MFDDARLKEKIKNLPLEYKVVRNGKKRSIKSMYIASVEMNKHRYILSAFEIDENNITVFNDYIEFQLFVFDNFFNLSKVTENRLTRTNEFYLKKGYLHSTNQAAYKKFDSHKLLESNYYLKGREIDEQKFKQILREKKLSRIV